MCTIVSDDVIKIWSLEQLVHMIILIKNGAYETAIRLCPPLERLKTITVLVVSQPLLCAQKLTHQSFCYIGSIIVVIINTRITKSRP